VVTNDIGNLEKFTQSIAGMLGHRIGALWPWPKLMEKRGWIIGTGLQVPWRLKQEKIVLNFNHLMMD